MDVADFILKQQTDTPDDEIQHDKFEQPPCEVFAAFFGLDDEEYSLEHKRQISGDQREQ